LFVFGDYQGTRAHDGGSQVAVVPTQDERNGNFSRWLPNNPIFDPRCTTGKTCVNGIQDDLTQRTQFQYNGQLNVIDPTLISQAAKNLLSLIPLPLPQLANAPPGQVNYAGSGDEIYHGTPSTSGRTTSRATSCDCLTAILSHSSTRKPRGYLAERLGDRSSIQLVTPEWATRGRKATRLVSPTRSGQTC